jgi:hypothetical protein
MSTSRITRTVTALLTVIAASAVTIGAGAAAAGVPQSLVGTWGSGAVVKACES